jgi:hypothetical protein
MCIPVVVIKTQKEQGKAVRDRDIGGFIHHGKIKEEEK